MGEEKKEKASECGCCSSKPLLKLIIGIVLITVGMSLVIYWWGPLKQLIKGMAGLFLVMAGAITLAIAKE